MGEAAKGNVLRTERKHPQNLKVEFGNNFRVFIVLGIVGNW